MPKIIKPLTSKEVAAISKIGLTTLGGVAGLMLLVKPEGARYFVYRFQVNYPGLKAEACESRSG